MKAVIHQFVGNLTEKSLPDIEVTERKRLTHQSNDLYDIKFDNVHWIAKVYVRADEFSTSPQREYTALQKLAHLDIAPKPIAYLPYPDYDQPIVIYEYMQGEMLNRKSPSTKQWHALAELWLKVSTISEQISHIARIAGDPIKQRLERSQSRYQIYLKWAEANFPQGLAYVQKITNLYDSHADLFHELENLPHTPLFIRSDPRFANIIVRPDGRLGMVDWEDSGLGDIAGDLSEVSIHANNEDLVTSEDWSEFLRVYQDNSLYDDLTLLRRIDIYRLLHSIVWLGGLLAINVQQIEAGQPLMKTINEMQANLRLRRYYARCLAYPKIDFLAEFEASEGIQFFPNK